MKPIKVFGTLTIRDLKAKELGLPIADVTMPISHADMVFGPVDGRYVITFEAPLSINQKKRSDSDVADTGTRPRRSGWRRR